MSPALDILVLVHALPGHRPGGLEVATSAMVAGLALRGHGVRIGTTAWPADMPHDVLMGPQGVDLSGVIVDALDGKPAHPSPRFWRQARRRAKEFMAARDPNRRVLAIDLAGMLLPKPYTLQVHGTMLSETTLHAGFDDLRDAFPKGEAWRRYWSRWLLQPMFRRMVKRARHVLVDSEFSEEELKAGGIHRSLHRVPLALSPGRAGILDAAFETEQARRVEPTEAFCPKRPLRLLTVGRVARIKGHAVMALAVKRAAAMMSEFGTSVPMEWTIVGGRSYHPDDLNGLPLQSADASAPPVALSVLGAVSDAELAQVFARHDLLLNLEYNQPAFGLVPLEAMRAGCVAVVSDRGALPEVVGQGDRAGGYLLPAGDASALADLLMRVAAEGPRALAEKRAMARRRALRFSFEEWIDGVETALM